MNNNKWWKNAFVYQIYPRSFKDGNNDGIGDLKGIIEKLDYLKYLGIDAIWLSPIYKSPMDDNGYDVEDYHEIADIFGSMDDMDTLISEAKKRNIKILMDLVANHTSSKHFWFQEALKGKDNKYHNYFYWSDKSLSNREADFGGNCWEYVPELNEYYFHYFAKSQIDLNWTNPEVRKEVANIVKFWLDKGVYGFRMDAIELIGKDFEKEEYANGPHIHEYLHELNVNSFGKYPESMTVGEGWPTPEIALQYVAPENQEVDMMFNFDAVKLRWTGPFGKWKPGKTNIVALKKMFKEWQDGLHNKGWNTLFWENHDLTRSVNFLGDTEKYRKESAMALAYTLYLLQGTPYIYQGQEIGMSNCEFDNLEDYKDIDSVNRYDDYVNRKKLVSHDEMIQMLKDGSRDNSRTPMQWDSGVNAGFNNGATPWINVNKNYKEINVENQMKDPDSILNKYKELIDFRKNSIYSDIILNGNYEDIDPNNEKVIVYKRNYENRSILVVTNMSNENVDINYDLVTKKVLLSSYKDSTNSLKKTLRPFESIVYEI